MNGAGAREPVSAYPPRDVEPPRAPVRAVAPGNPADDAGFEFGCCVTEVDGQPLHDLVDWCLAADDAMELGYIVLDGREEGEDWGFGFEGVVFDGVRQCRNACTFCFMRQLEVSSRISASELLMAAMGSSRRASRWRCAR